MIDSANFGGATTDGAFPEGRAARRVATGRRITSCALRLTHEHGVDGFTMDDLAQAAGVSRRTLFNYFPSKDDAILGDEPQVPAEAAERFVAGGPHGNLVDDLTELLRELLAAEDLDRADFALARVVLHEEPKLLGLARHRFEAMSSRLDQLTREREGTAYDARRVLVLFRLVGALFDLSLTTYVDDEDAELADLFAEAVQTARALLA